MESLSVCIVAGIVCFIKDSSCCNSRFQIDTEGVAGNKNDAIMTWLFQMVWTYALPEHNVAVFHLLNAGRECYVEASTTSNNANLMSSCLLQQQ